MSSLLDNVKQLLNLGVGDIGRLEHIKSSLEENKKLYSSDMNYVEKMIEQHIGDQDIVEQTHEIKSEPAKNLISDNHVEVINRPQKKGIFSKRKRHQCTECIEKFAKRDELINHGSVVHNRTILKCSKCNKRYLSYDSLIEHVKEYKVSLAWRMALSWTNLAFIDIEKFWFGALIRFITTLPVVILFGVIFGNLNLDIPEAGVILLAYWIIEPQMIFFMWRWAKKWNIKIDVMLKDISEDKNS